MNHREPGTSASGISNRILYKLYDIRGIIVGSIFISSNVVVHRNSGSFKLCCVWNINFQ